MSMTIVVACNPHVSSTVTIVYTICTSRIECFARELKTENKWPEVCGLKINLGKNRIKLRLF